MLWFLFVLMCLGAIAFTVRPMLRDLPRLNVLTGVSIVVLVAVTAGVYNYKGSPDVPSGRGEVVAQQPDDIMAMVEGLAARLAEEPNDVEGWKMLGRSQMALGNFTEAARAYERAVDLEDAQNVQTLLNLGVAIAQAGGNQALAPEAVTVFETAIALEPNNPEALFWSGFSAVAQGDTLLAADRWELLLNNNPPAELRPQIEAQIAVWRGETPPAPAAQAPAAEQQGTIVRASISVSETALAALPADATVFVIARDPAQPSPPIAVTRRRLTELPSVVELDDGDSMVPGKFLSGFAELEIVARVSLSGEPRAQPGDWFGSQIVRPADQTDIDLAIDEEVQ
ncbi:MAG: tetratricopeptide repeat protein [Woeseiaceae bacterium]|nr:tetratricopeptide repeat protein [Woeseiaceae bacterium]